MHTLASGVLAAADPDETSAAGEEAGAGSAALDPDAEREKELEEVRKENEKELEELLEEETEHQALGLSVLFMGMVVFVLLIFHLVKSSDPILRKHTWNLLSSTLSIFIAVLTYTALNELTWDIVGKFIGEEEAESIMEEGGIAVALVHLIMLLVLFTYLQAFLFFLRDTGLKLKTWALVLAHMTGFAATNCFSTIQALEYVRGDQLMVYGVILLAIVFGACLMVISRLVRGRAVQHIERKTPGEELQEVREKMEEWEDTVEETEDDATCLAVSFLIVQSVRFTIMGEYQSHRVADHVKETTLYKEILFIVATLIFAASSIVFTALSERATTKGFSGLTDRVLNLCRHTCAMAVAWLLVYISSRHLLKANLHGPEIGRKIFIAVCVSILAFVFSVLVKESTRLGFKYKALRSVILALGLLIGFLWERAFDLALEDITELLGLPPFPFLFGLNVLLVALVMPAWQWYIAPEATWGEED